MPWKGQAYVLDAFAMTKDLPVRLALIGDGGIRESLEDQAAALGIGDRVVFAGTVAHREMPRYLATADVVLGASVASETFGMALAEAMACGRPVLASSWRGYDDVVIPNETGARFAAGDPRALAESLRRLLAEEETRARLAAGGRRRVESLFRWETVAARVQAVYDRALSR